MSTIHNPSQFNPTDYVVIDYFDNRPPQFNAGWVDYSGAVEAFNAERDAWFAERDTLFPERNCYRCEHCGQGNVRWVVAAKHIPTGKHICFGNECAFRLGFASQSDFRAAQVRQRSEARAENIRKLVAREKFIATTPGLAELLKRAASSTNPFVRDVVAKLDRWGSLSPAQINAVSNALNRDEQRAIAKANEPQPTTPAPEGRVEISGTVLGVKEVHSDFGTSFKLLVRLPDHNKVWVTSPSSSRAERGWTIRLRATFTRSDRDEHFAFGSRPHLLDEQPPVGEPVAAVA